MLLNERVLYRRTQESVDRPAIITGALGGIYYSVVVLDSGVSLSWIPDENGSQAEKDQRGYVRPDPLAVGNVSGLQGALDAKAPASHTHAPADVTGTAVVTSDPRLSDARTPLAHGHPQSDIANLATDLAGKAAVAHTHTGVYEPANANIQAHIASPHAPANAQKNSDITKAEIEAVLTGTISSHSHAGGGGGTTKCRQLAAQTRTDGTLINATDLVFALTANTTYAFRFICVFRSTVATVGFKVGLTCPAFSRFSVLAHNMIAADGVGGGFQGTINASGDSVIGTATAVINADYPCVVEGVIRPTANGNLQLQFAAETTGATVTLQPDSVGIMETF